MYMMLKSPQLQIQQGVNILAQSFIDDPSFSLIFGETENKLEAISAFFEVFVTDVMQRGEVIIAPEEQGACLWYPAEVEIFNEQFEQKLAEVISIISRFSGSDAGNRFKELIERVGAKEPTVTHCEVFFLGLKPEARGKGIGKILIKPVLNYADSKQVGCYLVSSNCRN